MLQLENETPYAAERAVLLDRDGNKVWVVAVKATFVVAPDGTCVPAPQQESVTRVPQYFGRPGVSTLLRESELVVDHPGTTVTLNASAYAPVGTSTYALDAAFSVGPITKTVRVTGDRVWRTTAYGLVATEPVAFQTMPLTWERAFGGRHEHPDGTIEQYDMNPAGTGLMSSRGTQDGTLLPNVEYVQPASGAAGRWPVPAGFSAVPAAWSPRRELAGTFDDAWLASRSPLWPADYDPRHQLAAPADQVASTALRGGEAVVLHNLTPDGTLQFRLPRLHFSFDTFRRRAGRVSHRGQLDRVIIEPDLRRLVMVWRTTLACGADARAVEATVIGTKRVLR